MIEFMVIGAPRSGTAWAANWLTNEWNHCIHDPLWDHHYADLDKLHPLYPGKTLGISCTGIALWPAWLNEHPATKVILHRPPAEVNESCRKLGYPPCPTQLFRGLLQIRGFHVEWRSLFDSDHARDIHNHLVVEPFDGVRHDMLRALTVTANVKLRKQNPEVLERLRAEGIPDYGTLDPE